MLTGVSRHNCITYASSRDDHKSLFKYMQASNTLYRQVFHCYRNGKHYPVMEDEGKRQNEKEITEKEGQSYESKRLVRKKDHFHTSFVKHHNQLLNSMGPEVPSRTISWWRIFLVLPPPQDHNSHHKSSPLDPMPNQLNSCLLQLKVYLFWKFTSLCSALLSPEACRWCCILPVRRQPTAWLTEWTNN